VEEMIVAIAIIAVIAMDEMEVAFESFVGGV
jgi:hypothetical protein